MATLLRMPEISANATEAVLQEWSVAENTPFAADDTLATIETDKAAVDIEAENDGVIIKMLVAAGAAVEVGAPIALLGDPMEIVADLDALLAELGVAGSQQIAEGREVPDQPPVTPVNGGDPLRYAVGPAEVPQRPMGEHRGGRVFISPLARRLAKDAGLTVDNIPGTGPGGRVTRDDVDAVLAQRSTNGAVATGQPSTAAAPAAPPRPIPEPSVHPVVTASPGSSAPQRPAAPDTPMFRTPGSGGRSRSG